MALIKQSTAYPRTFLLVSSSDHVTGRTGVAPTVTLSKNGAAFGAAAGTVTELASGFYSIALTTVDTATLGDLAVHVTASGADPTDFVDQIVGFDPTTDLLSAQVPGAYASGSAGYALGTLATGIGPVEWTYTLRRSDNAQPIPGATIVITADLGGTSVLAGPLTTNVSGQITAFLPRQTVYVWRQAAGYSFTDPDVEVVT